MKINFYTNTDIIFWHIVDYASKWDFYVNQSIRLWLESSSKFTLFEKGQLDLLSKQRKQSKWGWTEETNFFRWAYNHFPPGKYDSLLPTLSHFRKLELYDRKSLYQFCLEKTKVTELFVKKLSTGFGKNESKIKKLSALFPSKQKDVDCFLPYSPNINSIQGGQNGDGLYVEVHEATNLATIQSIFEHEILHKLTNIRDFLSLHDNKFYSQQDSSFIQDRKGSFNEIFAYAADIILHSTDPDREQNFESPKHEGDTKAIWAVAKIFVPPMKLYLEEKLTITQTQEQLLKAFQDFVLKKV